MKYLLIITYLITITSSNIISAGIAPLKFGSIVVPAGAFIIGTVFVLRDYMQYYIGRLKTYFVILLSMTLSAIVSFVLDDTLWIVFASILAFAFSEIIDTEIFSRLKFPMYLRVAFSGIIGGTFDSVIFVVVGLSPIGSNILGWDAVMLAILGQFIIKTIIQVLAAIVIKLIGNNIPTNKRELEGFV